MTFDDDPSNRGRNYADDADRDYSAPRDFSTPADHSGPPDFEARGYTPGDYAPSKTQSALSQAEQAAASQPSLGGDADVDAAGKAERAAEPGGGQDYYRPPQRDNAASGVGGPQSVWGKVKAFGQKHKKGLVGGVTGVVGAGGIGWLVGMASLPGFIISKVMDGVTDVSNGVMSPRFNTALKSMLGKGCSGGAACKFQTMGRRQVQRLQDAGFTLFDSEGHQVSAYSIEVTAGDSHYTTGGMKATDRASIASIEVPDDLKMSLPKEHWTLNAGNITEAMNASPELRAGLKKVYNPKFAGYSDSIFAKALARWRAAKKSSIPRDGETSGDDTAKAAANDDALARTVNEGTDVKAGEATYRDVDDGHGGKQYEAIDNEGNVITDPADGKPITGLNPDDVTARGQKVLTDAADALDDAVEGGERSAKKAVLEAAENAGESKLSKVLGWFSATGNVLNYPCGALNALRALNFGVKTVRNIQLIRLFIDMAAAFQAAQAGDGDPNQVGYYMGKLTQGVVDKVSGENLGSAMDSVYMQNLLFGDRLEDDDSSVQFKASSSGGLFDAIYAGVMGFMQGVMGALTLGWASTPENMITACKTVRSIGFQVGDVLAGVAIKVISGIFTAGGATAAEETAQQSARVAGKAAAKEGFDTAIHKVLSKVFSRQGAKIFGMVAAQFTFEMAMNLLPQMLKNVVAGQVIDDSTIGKPFGDAVAVGGDLMNQQNCASEGGCAPQTAEQHAGFVQYALRPQMLADAEEARVGSSWWDASNPYTALGSVADTLSVRLAGATASPAAFAGKLFGLVGSAFTGFLSPLSAAADDSAAAYECDDGADTGDGYAAIGLGCDWMGVPSYGLSVQTDLDETVNWMDNKGFIDSEGEFTSTFTNTSFYKRCIASDIPLGSVPLEGGFDLEDPFDVANDGRGENCMESASSITGSQVAMAHTTAGPQYVADTNNTVAANTVSENEIMYNYLAYKRVLNSMDDEPNSTDQATSSGTTTGAASGSADTAALTAEFLGDLNGSGCYGAYCISANGCTTLSSWYVNKKTTLTYGNGNGGQVAQQLVNTNSGLSIEDPNQMPQAPAVFSSTDTSGNYDTYHTTGAKKCPEGSKTPCGHTGLLVSVQPNGDGSATLTLMDTYQGLDSKVESWTTAWHPGDNWQFVYVGDHLK